MISFFLVPYALFVISYGNFLLYRFAQAVWIVAAIWVVFIYKRSKINITHRSLLLISIISVNGILASVTIALDGATVDLDLPLKVAALIGIIIIVDQIRFIGFDRFCKSNIPVATIMLGASALHLIISPEIEYGRYNYFSMHPNVGGEIIFACLCIISFSERKSLFIVSSGIAVFCLILLQSRSALLACIVLIALVSARNLGRSRLYFLTFYLLVTTVIFLCIVLIAFGTQIGVDPAKLIGFIANDVFLLNDQYRGVGTGLSGRSDTWIVARETFNEHPLFGVGLDQGGLTERGAKIHSGPILLLAEFGLTSLLLFGIIVTEFLRSLSVDRHRFAVIASCIVIFLFQARGLNLNLFPLLLWIACIKWPRTGSALLNSPLSAHPINKSFT